jgi:hypothetical protein
MEETEMTAYASVQLSENIVEALETATRHLNDAFCSIREASELARDDYTDSDGKLKDLVGLLSIASRETAQELSTWMQRANARRSEYTARCEGGER